MSDIKQVIVIRKDLKMRRGKEIAQGSHASSAFLLRGADLTVDAHKWIQQGTTKIVVCVDSEEELLDIYQAACDAGLTSHIIRDAGHTEFNGVPTLTACAIGPNKSTEIDKITSRCRLY